jgi:guanylate cyclase soluble subunit beta
MIAAGKLALGHEQEAIDDMEECITAALSAGDANSAIAYATVLCDWLVEHDRYRDAYDLQQRIMHIQRDVSEKELERALEVSTIRSRLDQERESVRLRDEERNRVLHSVFPPTIATRLMQGEMPIADRVDNVALLFVDIVSFTTLASTVQPEELLNLLERLFTQLDEICHAHGCERIKTIGDAYMAVSMSAQTLEENVERMMRAALEMIDASRALALPPDRLRLGMHAGPVVAGVMGGARLSYDMWGDTVNVAARMEEYSAPGRITCSPSVAEVLRGSVHCTLEMREPLAIHGKGLMTTYWLSAR